MTTDNEGLPFDFTEDAEGIQRLLRDGHLPQEPPEHFRHFGSTWEEIFPAVREEIEKTGGFTLPAGPVTDADVESFYETFRNASDSEEHLEMFRSLGIGETWGQIHTSMLDRDKVPRDVEDSIRVLRRQVDEGILPPEPPDNFLEMGHTWEDVFQTIREKDLNFALLMETAPDPDS